MPRHASVCVFYFFVCTVHPTSRCYAIYLCVQFSPQSHTSRGYSTASGFSSDLPLPLAQAPTSNVLHISYSITRGAGIDKECIQYEIRHTSRCGRPLVSMVMRISGLHGSGVQIVRRASDRATVYAMDTVPLLGKTRRSRRGREVLHVARLEELAWLCVVVEELTWLRAL